jgi:hypothetical protein
VLLNAVKCLNTPEQVIASLVWFERVDRFERIVRRSLHLSALKGFVVLGSAVSNWKVDGPRLWRIVPRVGADQLIGEMVEAAHQILDDVPGNQGETIGGGLDRADVINQLARLRITLGPNFIRVGIQESPDLSLQVRDVLFGPFDF